MSYIGELQANTAVDILIGPFVDDADGKTAETGLTIDVEVSKNGQALVNKNDATAPVHEGTGTIDGYYNCELDTTDTNTEGLLTIVCFATGALPVRHDAMVLSQAAWLSKYTAKDSGLQSVDVVNWNGTAVSAPSTAGIVEVNVKNIANAAVNAASAQLGVNVVNWKGSAAQAMTGDAYARIGAPTGASISADIVAVKAETAAIVNDTDVIDDATSGLVKIAADVAAVLVDTAVIGALGAGLTAIPWNAAWDAEVESECTDALVALNLDHLVKIAVDTNFATTVHLDSVIGQLSDNGTTATFDRTTDSVEAIRDRGDAAWVTATGFATPTNITAGTITTVTNLTNAPTVGDLTAAMIASVQAAADAAVTANTIVLDLPTTAEFNARTLPAADYTIVADLGTVQTGDVFAALPTNFSALSISLTTGLVDITQTAADKVWGTAARVLTAGTNIALAKGTGVTGLNDLDAAGIATAVWNAATITYGAAGSYGLLIETNLDAPVSGATAPTAATIADAVWDELVTGHDGAGKAGAQLWTDIDAILADTGELQTNQGAWLTATGFSTHDAAAVVTALGTGSTLTACITATGFATTAEIADVPTVAEFNARTLPSADYTIVSDLGTVQSGDSYAIVNGTAGLVAIDTVVDAIKVQTDKLTFTVTNQIDSNVQYINDTALQGNGEVATPWGPV